MIAILAVYTAVEVVTMIGAISSAIIGMITAWRTGQVRREVKTINGQTLAQFADATETRRVDAIPVADRTAAEDEHVASVNLGGTSF